MIWYINLLQSHLTNIKNFLIRLPVNGSYFFRGDEKMTGNTNKKLFASFNKEDLLKMREYYQNQLNNDAIQYLTERGINDQTIKKFEIGYEKDILGFQPHKRDYVGYFRNRIIFPLKTVHSEMVDFVGRSVDGKEPKYKSFIGVEDVFFNEDILSESEDVLFCNSIFDVLSLDQAKLPAVCSIYNQVYENQIEKLTGKRVFLCFGNDEIGRRESIRIAKTLEGLVNDLYIIHLPEGFKDINDFFVRVKNPIEEFINLLNITLKESLISPISPDSSNLTLFQEEYLKRHNGNVKGIKTGFDQVDKLLVGGLKEGLYLIGGNVSVGKTTFLKQLADQIVEQIPVIYVSWDMTSFELWVKSMARLTGFSTEEILAGSVPVEEIQKANLKYVDIANYIWTIDANIDFTLEDIAISINKILRNLNRKPVIILDYLQRIRLKEGLKLTQQEEQRQICYNLHQWSRQWGITILLATAGKEQDVTNEVLASVDVYMTLEGNAQVNQSPIQLIIRKNRNGALGDTKLMYNKVSGEFSKISEDKD